ncbi:carboxymuconolactone decarboxylase family protein [Streptomyces sp. NPDC014734]|uniref:carboxymuconolactone decarboxylase family protein n=1 Tax=Streptomyces sp. NPDC014734 TaxID=3364886 RepID=UPI0036FC4AC6
MRTLIRAALRQSLGDIRHITPVAPTAARGPVARVYHEAERDFGLLAPPLVLHSPAPTALAASWLLLRETLLVPGHVDRALKEAVATAVSRANTCPYCVEIHQAKLDTLPTADDGERADVLAWFEGEPGRVADRDIPELAGVATTFHYLNRMAGLFLPASPLPRQAPRAVRDPMLRMVARSMRPTARGPLLPGASLDLLPPAPLPADLAWAAERPAVAGALARSAAALDAAVAPWLAQPVGHTVDRHIERYDGTAPGPGRAWLTEALAALPPDRPLPGQRPVAALALLTALAPYRITDDDIRAFRAVRPTDRDLVELTSWAALRAARHLGTRLAAPAHQTVPSNGPTTRS